MNDTEDFFAHYGVKGMKWGVRKDRKGRSGRAVKKRGGRSYDPKKMNNRDLKKVIDRMKLEQEYTSLNKKSRGEGKEYVQDIVKSSGKTLVGAAVGGTATFFVKKYLDNNFGKGASAPKTPKPKGFYADLK